MTYLVKNVGQVASNSERTFIVVSELGRKTGLPMKIDKASVGKVNQMMAVIVIAFAMMIG